MEAFESECASGRAEDVGDPVEGVISTPARGERLVKFVQNPDQPEDGDGD